MRNLGDISYFYWLSNQGKFCEISIYSVPNTLIPYTLIHTQLLPLSTVTHCIQLCTRLCIRLCTLGKDAKTEQLTNGSHTGTAKQQSGEPENLQAACMKFLCDLLYTRNFPSKTSHFLVQRKLMHYVWLPRKGMAGHSAAAQVGDSLPPKHWASLLVNEMIVA